MVTFVRLTIISLALIETGLSFPSMAKEKREIRGIEEQAGENKRILAKRGSLDFFAMVSCEIGRNPLEYIGYGCWCGLGGKGKPVDEIDRCCEVHDKCYDDIVDRGTCGWFSKITIYGIFYYTTDCTGCGSWWNSKCQKALCECDAAATRCLKYHNSSFQNIYKDYDKSSC